VDRLLYESGKRIPESAAGKFRRIAIETPSPSG
jgi:hypothetical protein